MRDITRREFGEVFAAGVGTVALSTAAGAREVSPMSSRQPNVVFICSDQHSHKYAGYAGHPMVKTPNLDRIAGQGVAFTSAYCGSPVCVAGRASMMTGMYPSDCNSFCNSTVWDGSHPLWGLRLREVGYDCRATGKLDLNDDFDTGFKEIDTAHGHRHNPDITSLFRRPVAYRVNERPNVDGGTRDEPHIDAKFTERAVDFIRNEARSLEQPWVYYAGLRMPHPKFVALKKYYELYPADQIPMPHIPPGHLEDLHLVFQELRRFKRIATPIPEDRIRRARAAYFGMISELDEYVGKIWDALAETGQLENTVFVYTSDHGESLGEHGLWYKNNLYDDAARIPLIMAGPGIPRGRVVDTPVGHVDLVLTLLDLAGAARPSYLRGHSLRPLMEGKAGDHPGFAYTECHSEGNCTGGFMVRKGDWKYIHFTWYDDLLFNLAEDPGEFKNRVDDPGAEKVLAELRGILHGLVEPEEVTLRAFKEQERMLQAMAGRMTEAELSAAFESRMGPGLARVLAAKCKAR